MTPQAIMIFAAGLGTRMAALTRDRPKPLIRVAGKALIDHALDLTGPLGPVRRVVNVHYRAAMLRAHLAGRDIVIADESGALLETGGGLRAALPLLGAGPVWTLNADALWTGPNPLLTLARAWDGAAMEALLLLVPLAGATGHKGKGDFARDADLRLRRGGPLVYVGAQILRTEGLAEIAEPAFSLNRLWDQAAARGGLFGVMHPGGWCDVGQPESLPLAEAMLRGAHVF